jgi:hypothetical protein
MSESEKFASRVGSVFAALGDPVGSSTWRLNINQGFRAGAENPNGRDEDEEDECPQALSGADSDEEQTAYECKASVSYRRAFEAEADEDEFDTLAAGGLHAKLQEDRPAAFTEASMPACMRDLCTISNQSNFFIEAMYVQVADDNAFERASQRLAHALHEREQQEPVPMDETPVSLNDL